MLDCLYPLGWFFLSLLPDSFDTVSFYRINIKHVQTIKNVSATVTAQHKNCTLSAIVNRPGRDLFSVM